MFISSCHTLGVAQQKPRLVAPKKPAAQIISDGWKELRKSRDSVKLLITSIKSLADQKIVYRTKIIEHRDTAWRIDTCITVISKIDSANIALIFKQRDIAKPTSEYRHVFFIFRKKLKPAK